MLLRRAQWLASSADKTNDDVIMSAVVSLNWIDFEERVLLNESSFMFGT